MEVLKLRNIHTSFEDNQVHRGLDLTLHRGETLGLLGGSGAGKSLLLRSIIGIENIQSGEILFNGERIDTLSEEKMVNARKRIAYAFQNGALFDSMSVYENLAWPLKRHLKLSSEEIDRKVDDMLNLVGLANAKYLMPSDLSGGMQKRIGLARAIILDPEVILYDEPTAGLDPKNTANILKIMRDLKSNQISSIFVTHDIAAAMDICDRIVILHEGKIKFSGTPSDMKKSNEEFIKDFFAMEGKNHAN